MNNLEIEAILFTNETTRKSFIGAFTPNELDKLGKFKNEASFVINICPIGSTCHWCSVYMDKQSIQYFDSSGTKSFLLNSKIKNFLLRQKRRKVFVNQTTIQSNTSELCGLFCIMFIFFISKGKTIKYFINKFNKNVNLKENDKILLNLFKKHM